MREIVGIAVIEREGGEGAAARRGKALERRVQADEFDAVVPKPAQRAFELACRAAQRRIGIEGIVVDYAVQCENDAAAGVARRDEPAEPAGAGTDRKRG